MASPQHEPRRITYTWAAACALTVVSAVLATVADGDSDDPSIVVSFVVLAMGAIKAGLILEEFMEVRFAPAWLQWSARCWLVGLLGAIVVLYLQ